ncbi:MAG: glycosyltransferase [Anaerolineae bacterium]|nr:glycosyltransferase [Anaerolineae bacterium]
MTAIVVISTLAMILGIIITWQLHASVGITVVVERVTEPWEEPQRRQAPLISVIIPARNEQRNILRCLQALLDQSYPNYEIIVIDDHSTDATPQILAKLAAGHRLVQILHGNDLPPGWAGKPHALVQGAAAARGEWLCFLDADTFASPELLTSAYQAAINNAADMFSMRTAQELGSFWERTVLPLVFLGLAYGFPAERVNDPAKPDAIANGQFILIRRSAYDAVGGHAAVKDRIDEDRALAAVVKRAGFRLMVADGRTVASTRMYTSLPEMWEGWTKNIYLGLQDRLWLLLFGAFVGLVVSIALPVWLFGSLAWLISTGGQPATLVSLEALCLWGYLLIKRVQACREFGIAAQYAFAFPLGALVFTAMMGTSAFNVISGRGVSWKGRRYR